MPGASDHPVFSVTVDVVVLALDHGAAPAGPWRLSVLLVERAEPVEGRSWALPGGFVHVDEDLPAAARRELGEETGLAAASLDRLVLDQLASYGAPDRDPRGRTVTVAYLGVLPEPVPVRGATDAVGARWVPVDELPGPLAFDHDRILGDAVERLRSKIEYTALAAAFLPEEFSLADLRTVYDAVWGTRLDPANFQRKARANDGIFVETDVRRPAGSGRGRPARLFRCATDTLTTLPSPFLR